MSVTAPQDLIDWFDATLGLKGEITISPIAGGQSNPTWFVSLGGEELVLRKQPPGELLKGAHAIDREFRVQQALWPTAVPVPKMRAYCTDAAILGTPFYVMDRVPGRVCHTSAMEGATPAERREMYLDAARVMAKMHSVAPEDVGLGDYGRPGNYFERQVARWGRQWDEAKSRDVPRLDVLRDWLLAHLPPDDGISAIAHGDFRIGNLLFGAATPDVTAVLDWELSTLGHPLADLGYFCMFWRSASSEYGGLADLDWRALGIPSKEEVVAAYMAESRHELELTAFHEAFALFRFAVIFVGIADRALQGNAAGDAARDALGLARAYARHGAEAAGI